MEENNDDDTALCSLVECDNIGTLFCGACGDTRYCSVKCQKQDWKKHKKECSKRLQSTFSPPSTGTSTPTTQQSAATTGGANRGSIAALAFNPPPKEVALQSNMGIPCYTMVEFDAMLVPPVIFPPCVICGAANAKLWCPQCLEWKLPCECYCSKQCFERDYGNHIMRLHRPYNMWVLAKEKVSSASAGDAGRDTRVRVMEMIERMKPHPVDRIEEMRNMARMGKQWTASSSSSSSAAAASASSATAAVTSVLEKQQRTQSGAAAAGPLL